VPRAISRKARTSALFPCPDSHGSAAPPDDAREPAGGTGKADVDASRDRKAPFQLRPRSLPRPGRGRCGPAGAEPLLRSGAFPNARPIAPDTGVPGPRFPVLPCPRAHRVRSRHLGAGSVRAALHGEAHQPHTSHRLLRRVVPPSVPEPCSRECRPAPRHRKPRSEGSR